MMQAPRNPADFTAYTSPDHFGSLLKWLRDRHGIAQANVVGHLPSTIDQQRYSSFELDKRLPLFDELPLIYQALKDAKVRLTVRDRNLFVDLARVRLESKRTHKVVKSDQEWDGLRAKLAEIDGLPDLPVFRSTQQKRNVLSPRREIGHLLGREEWLASVVEMVNGSSQTKILVIQGPPGSGKTSELHRLANHFLQHVPRYYSVLSEPPPIQLGRLEPTDVLETLLGDVLEMAGSAYAMMPTTSLQARISYVLECLAKADRPIIICLDNAEHIFDAQGVLEMTWRRFLTQFVQATHRATFILTSQEWSLGTFLEESQLIAVVAIPRLSQTEGARLLQTLGIRNASEELLCRAVDAVGGVPICLEWLVRLVREPLLRDDWANLEDEEDEGVILERLLEDPALFGGSVAHRVQPLLDRVLRRLSGEATAALQDLALAPIPLGSPALKALYQSPRVLRELREASLLVAYPQRIQLLPMVAAQVRRNLASDQVSMAEERLIQSMSQWLHVGVFHKRESGNIITELASLQLKHGQVLETAHLLVRYGWASFNLGHGPRLARLIRETLLPLDQDDKQDTAVMRKCGSLVLLHYLSPFLEEGSGRSLETDYWEILAQIHSGTVRVQASFEVHILHHLMVCILNKGRFEEAAALFESTFERLAPYTSQNSDLHASLLERQAYLLGRRSDWFKERGEQEASRVQLNQALTLYQQCVTLLANDDKTPPTLEVSIRQKRRARVLNSLGYRLNGLGRYGEAKNVIEQSILLKEQGFTEIGALASSYGEMAQALAGLGNYQEAFYYSDKALEEVQRLARAGHQSSQEEVWIYLVERGKLHWMVGQPEQAERLLNEAKPHIQDRRSAFRMMAQYIIDDIEQWKNVSSSSIYQLDWRWIDELRQWVSFPLYEWLDAAGPLALEEQQQIALLMGLETEEAREQKHTIIHRSQQQEVARALDERRNPRFTYPAIPLERVRLHIEKLRGLDARILQEEPNCWVREWYHGTIDEHLSLLYLVEAAAAEDDTHFWSFMRHLFPEPSEVEQQEVLTYVKRVLLQASVKEELKDAVRQTAHLFATQFGISFDLALRSEETSDIAAAQPLTPPGDTGKMVSAQVAKLFFDRIFEQHGYIGWRIMLSAHASNPYADSPSRQLVLPITDLSVKQILSIYEHAVLDHIESTVAGEQSRLGLLGIGLPDYTLSREGSALYQQRQTAEEAGKPFDDSAVWAGALGILLACRIIDSHRAFYWVYTCLQQVFYLYRCLRRPDQDETVAKEKAGEIALKYCLQLYRGKPHIECEGCWTKPVVYLRGLHLIERAVAEDPTILESLSLGKMAVEHIPLLRDLQVLPSQEDQRKKEKERQNAEMLLLSLAEKPSQDVV